ncbi:Beta-lactamase domain-containing protein [Mycena venus]|uniref:Beta-lactamase domain-containing protein n=1 Tax=Mycena venus TaxID=2733690 RepID=A0A8H6XXZ8_9AGAR|nr:Beta-lactamase domain-containing protein [Mycena venus]
MANSVDCPVLTLPTEIAGDIFSDYVGKAHDIRQRDSGPLVLISVCQRWREIGLSTCSLWASVSLLITSKCRWNDAKHFPLFELWLFRAGSHPLDISVSAPNGTPSRMLSFLSRYSAQWRSFAFFFHPSEAAVLDDLIHGYIPYLAKLDISGIPDGSGPVLLNAFREAPSLREVSLSHAALQSVSLPWIQLTHLKINGSLFRCMKILKETPNLQVLDLEIDLQIPSSLPTSLRVTLAHLHTFTFCFGFEGTVLDHLALPALRAVELSFLNSDGVARLLTMGARSAWSPRVIHLASMTSERSILCLGSLPSLEEVKLTTSDNLTPLLKLFTDDDHFLPALRSLTIQCERPYPVVPPTSTFAAMLASRWHRNREGVAPLTRFHLSFPHGRIMTSAIEELRTTVRPLMEEGLDVVINFGEFTTL